MVEFSLMCPHLTFHLPIQMIMCELMSISKIGSSSHGTVNVLYALGI